MINALYLYTIYTKRERSAGMSKQAGWHIGEGKEWRFDKHP
jgi:hypothetical protein